MSLILHFLRHGQTAFSRENDFSGSGMDPDLTGEGQQMAAAFAAAYRTHPWQAIFSSPLRRTLATARPLSDAIRMPVRTDDRLREIAYGEWEGQSVEEVGTRFHDDYLRWTADPAWNAPTGGETAVAIARRGLQVVEEIRSEFQGGNVLVVSHKATIRVLVCSLLGIDVGRFRFRLACPVGSVTRVEFGAHGPLLLALADRSHLGEDLCSLPGT